MGPPNLRPSGKVFGAAVLAVAATYGYFLIFAQFGFLKAVVAAEAGGVFLRPVMVVMGLAGIAGSVLAAWVYEVRRSRRLLAAGFATCAVAVVSSFAAGTPAGFYVVAFLVGLGAGFTTVTLASILRRVLGGERLGLAIGLGTGAAYGLCNLPGVFTAGAAVQAGWALLAAGAGLTGTLGLAPGAPPPVPPGAGYARIGVTAWVAVLLALVFLDSAAFYIIQHTPALLADSWQGAGRLLANAAMHFVAAIAAGWLLDRGWVGGLTALGALLLLLACGLVASGHPIVAGTVLLYTAGVSIYSTVLVYYPAYGSRPWLAALVYAVAGWGGSALGIGLAQSRSALPPAIVVGAAAVIGAGLLVPRWCRRHLG